MKLKQSLLKGSRGTTVVELLVAATVLSLLSLLTLALFKTGASGWRKLEAQSGLLADYEVLAGKLTKEIQRSVGVSASTGSFPDGDTVAFLSAVDDTGTFTLDTSGSYEPVWQKYLIFNYDKTKRQVTLAEVKLLPGSPEALAPEPIETYDAGLLSLAAYRATEGRLLMKDVDSCTFSLANSILTMEITGSRKRYGREDPETLHMKASAAFRN